MSNADDALLSKINAAVVKHNAAEKAHEATHAELVSQSKVVGRLLLEAKKRHPKVVDFEAFLKRVNGLKRSRAYDLLRLAGGRATDEELRQEARERKRNCRARKKLPPHSPSLPTPEPTLDTKPTLSVTDPHVTESLGIGAKESTSSRALAEFTVACRIWLPKLISEADRHKARLLVAELTNAPKAEAA